jgi:hypothetical protein
MRYQLCIFLAILLFQVGCGTQKKERPTLFNLLDSNKTGIDFSNDLTSTGELNIIEYLYFYNGGGVALGDINNDGFDDIFFTANQGPNKLYLNTGNLTFKDITEEAGIINKEDWSTGVSMADVNGDGFLDIYVCKVGNYKLMTGSNQLFINNGDLTFTEKSAEFGLNFSGFSTHTAFFDYDRDGDLDVYLLNHAVHTTRSYSPATSRSESDPLAGDRFLQNQLDKGSSKFKDVTEETGIFSSAQGFGLGLVVADINQDGWVDIYVGNDFHEDDYLYINQKNGSFKESLASFINHTSRFTMGVDIADVNGDQLLDIFSLDMLPADNQILMKSGGEDGNKITEVKLKFGYKDQYARNAFQLNNANQSFSDIALLTDTYATDWSWSVLLQDYDNDGLSDIYITNGIYRRPNDLDYINFLSNINLGQYDETDQDSLERELIEAMPTLKIPNNMFKNGGGINFNDVGTDWGVSDASYSNGAAYSDLDNDGDLDLVVNNINCLAFIYENRADTLLKNRFLNVKLQAAGGNKFGIGADIYVFANNLSWRRELLTTRGFESSSSPIVHFGLGEIDKIDSVLIRWPDGGFQTVLNPEVNALLTILKGDLVEKSEVTFQESNVDNITQLQFNHTENSYNDYDIEGLIPEKLSTEGPAFVKADFNGDGNDDFFIGSARDQSAGYFVQDAKGDFKRVKITDFILDQAYEDVDAAAFDFDKDGDLDLYVMSGGNDREDGSIMLMDRIYLNDNGQFKKLKMNLPTTNGGAIAVGDFNKDGFPDIFVGGRSIPGAYGIAPMSYILKNESGKGFSEIKSWEAGMVTDAIWGDVNADDFDDLILVGDWMNVTILQNKDGIFTDKTDDLQLGATSGMWNVIKIADINKDGKPDLVAGNVGSNSKINATINHPITLFLDDFDQNGQIDPVLFYWKNGVNIPFFGKDDLIRQMPYLKKKFLSYQSYSEVSSISELTDKNAEDILFVKNIQELRSGVFINRGDAFEFQAFPKEAQLSTIEDFEFIDPDNDGFLDIVYIGNFFGSVTSIGKFDAKQGGYLNNVDGVFKPSGTPIQIPFNYEYRAISSLGIGKFVVIPNNQNAFIWKVGNINTSKIGK